LISLYQEILNLKRLGERRMRKLRNIAIVVALAFVFAGIAGCGGCNPAPVPTSLSPMEGPEAGRTTVRITGEKFDMKKGVSVKFGTQNATSVNVPSETQITAVTPPGTAGQSVSVIVSNKGNTKPEGTVTMSQKFTYTDATPPTITGNSPSDGTVVSNYEDSLNVSVPISITFSEAVNTASGSVTVSVESTPDSISKQSGQVSGNVGGSGNTVTFTPNELFRSGRKYTVNVSGFKDASLAGNLLASSHSFSFSISAPESVAGGYYTVRNGDTLPIIAARPEVYDDASLWPRLVEANQDTRNFDRNRIYEGERLAVPARGEAWGDPTASTSN